MPGAHRMSSATDRDTRLLEYYVNEGIKLVRLDGRTRKPIDNDWPATNIPLEDMERHVSRRGGVGVDQRRRQRLARSHATRAEVPARHAAQREGPRGALTLHLPFAGTRVPHLQGIGRLG